MSKAFISYSHRDEKALDRLHTHLAMLRRENLITAWYDRELLAGSDVDREISSNLNDSDLFIALVSPDFLESNYCYEREMEAALNRSVSPARNALDCNPKFKPPRLSLGRIPR